MLNVRISYPPKPMKLAYVKHDFNRAGFNIVYYPSTVTLQDQPKGDGKGRQIPIESNWWKYIEKINDERGYRYARSIQMMWINSKYDNQIKYSTGHAESICCGGNFVSYDLETDTHLRLITYPNNLDTSALNPLRDNWYEKPYMFWKACAVEANGAKVIKVGADIDMYIPLICNVPQFGKPAELWIRRDKVEILGEQAWSFHNGAVYLDGVLVRDTGAVR